LSLRLTPTQRHSHAMPEPRQLKSTQLRGSSTGSHRQVRNALAAPIPT
jgi:hypothetical protein